MCVPALSPVLMCLVVRLGDGLPIPAQRRCVGRLGRGWLHMHSSAGLGRVLGQRSREHPRTSLHLLFKELCPREVIHPCEAPVLL